MENCKVPGEKNIMITIEPKIKTFQAIQYTDENLDAIKQHVKCRFTIGKNPNSPENQVITIYSYWGGITSISKGGWIIIREQDDIFCCSCWEFEHRFDVLKN